MENPTKLERLYTMLDAACELLKARATELGKVAGDRSLYDDEEYLSYLRVQFGTYDKIRELENL